MHKNKLFVLSLLCFSAVSMFADVATEPKRDVMPEKPVVHTVNGSKESLQEPKLDPASTTKATEQTATAAQAEPSKEAQAWYKSFQRPVMPSMPTMPTRESVAATATAAVASSAAAFETVKERAAKMSLPSEQAVDGWYANTKASARSAHSSVSDVYSKVHARVSAQAWLRANLRTPIAVGVCLTPVYVAYCGVKAVATGINSGYNRVKSAIGFAPKA